MKSAELSSTVLSLIVIPAVYCCGGIAKRTPPPLPEPLAALSSRAATKLIRPVDCDARFSRVYSVLGSVPSAAAAVSPGAFGTTNDEEAV